MPGTVSPETPKQLESVIPSPSLPSRLARRAKVVVLGADRDSQRELLNK